jgi:DNA polymerase-1
MDELPKEAEERGFVTTILGRKRYLPDLTSPNRTAQQAARRMAINTTVQGSAADLIKLAMIRVSEAMERDRLPGRMILQVHDELILEVLEEAVEDAEALLREEMSNVYPLAVPLVVDTAVGRNWEEAH